uniref:Calsequestrin n=1 Tax=Setaria digitata TaxID=48799 RepID=A0A915PR97_9BILA
MGLVVVALLLSSLVPRSGRAANAKTLDINCMFLGYPELEFDGFDRTELSAQIMTKRGYSFYTVNTTKEARLRKQENVEKGEDTIHVYKDGYKIEYFGVRDPETFVSWLMDIPDDPITIINDEHDQEGFEALEDEVVRVIGYFEPGSVALKEYEEAAEDFMGEVEFYAVVNSYWARKMGLKRVGEVQMLRPFEDDPIYAPTSVDTEGEFEGWVEKHKKPVMQKLTLQNYFNVWKDREDDEKLIVAFCDEESREGRAMFRLLQKIADENSEHAGTLKISLIDPDEFPLMVDIWEEMFGIDIEGSPQLGLVDISDVYSSFQILNAMICKEGIWFDMSQLNLDDPKKHQDSNLEVLQSWIDQIMSGNISLDDDEEDNEPEPPKAPSPPKSRRSKKEL